MRASLAWLILVSAWVAACSDSDPTRPKAGDEPRSPNADDDPARAVFDSQVPDPAVREPHLPIPDPAPWPPAMEPHPVQLTEGTNMAAAVSPDGQHIAFTLQGTLWSMPISGGKATPLTDAMGDCHIPTWSPDGSWIAFQSYRSGTYHIWRVRPDATGLEQLTHGAHDDREPHWSPVGPNLIFSSDREGSYELWNLNVDSGDLRRLTTTAKKASWPAYAPDGQRIAYLVEDQGLYLMDADEEDGTLVHSGSDLAAPAWSPDGSSLIFARVGAATTQQLRLSVADGSTQTLSPDDVDIFPFRASWVDGELLYTADGGFRRRPPEESTAQRVPFTATVELWRPPYTRRSYPFDDDTPRPALGIRAPALAPDGESLIFSALGDLWLKRTGSTAQQLTKDHYVDLDPAWSPSGDRIVFATDRSGNMELWILSLEDGFTEQLTDKGLDLVYPAWSPDGAWIACLEVGRKNLWSNATLSLVNATNGATLALGAPIFVPSRPSWAPDSEHLALATLRRYSRRFREGVSEIRIVNIRDQSTSYFSPTPYISMGPRGASGPAWSPQGDALAFVQGGKLWLQDVSPTGRPLGAPEPLTSVLSESPTWSNDGRLLALSNGQLQLIEPTTGLVSPVDLELSWTPEINQGTYAVHAGRLWDGLQTQYREDVDVIIQGQRIVAVEAHRERDFPVVDASEATVIPGLFDMHVHQHGVVGERLGRSWLAYGITSVREVGADPYDALERKEAWAAGVRPGPRLFFTGGLLNGARIYYGLSNSVTTPEHRDWEMERIAALGYDLVKTYVRLPDSDQRMYTQRAHGLGIPVSSHEIYPAAAFGVDAVEHLGATSRRGFSLKQSALRIAYQDVRTLLAESGMFITPTLGIAGGMVLHISLDPGALTAPGYAELVPEAHRQSFEAAYRRSTITQTRRLLVARQQRFLRELLDAGGKITAGTDVPFLPYGWSLHVELQLYVDGGLTPLEALRSATLWAAESLGVEADLGTLEAGKLADLVIVDGDPLTNIRDAWKVKSVIKGGTLHSADQLRNP